ncbi:DUF4349 domain-containing protein [Lacrimispora indolis]|uniref:DUF4349 domain-containing protein n=1 Tax=Lacrimispora indolis TaxID=69825 RepID=UPI00041C7C47|nr:DUF4349 domain-containing protein [[Clostridium] methoxybenzovorans]
MRKRTWGIALSLLTVLCLSACAGKSGTMIQGAAPDYGIAMQAETSVSVSADSQQQNVTEEKAAASLESETGSGPMLPAGRKLIRNISMNVETDAFDTLVSSLQTKITQLDGYVEQSDMSGSRLDSGGKPIPRFANMTIRIPVNQIDSFISTVENNGNVTDKSESTQDVTLQYSDLESKKKSLEIEQEKLWEFLEKAESVDTVITLQQRLSEIRYQMESMESQLRLYDNQVDYSTVHLTIREVTIFTPVAAESALTRISRGFTNNFQALKTMMTNSLIGVIISIPFWLPIVLVAGIVSYFLRKGRKKKNPALPQPKKEKEDTTVS